MHQRAHLFRERLRVPVRWWVLWNLMLASFWLAMIVAVPESLTWGITATLVLVSAMMLRTYGSATIKVDDSSLQAGRARIASHYLGAAQALDVREMRAASGHEADARAYLLLRPYIRTGVRIWINDAHDPTPYWLISSRRPELLVAALDAVARECSPPSR